MGVVHMNLQETSIRRLKGVSDTVTFKNNEEKSSSKSKILDTVNWKSSSITWRIINILIFTLALLASFILPLKQSVILEPYRFFLVIVIAYFTVINIISLFNFKIKAKVNHNAQLYSGVGVVLIIWDLLTTKSNTLPLPFFPSFAQILQVIVEDYKTLMISTGYSIRLLVIGFTIGTILGVV